MVLRLVHQQGRRANGHAGPIELTGQPSQQARSTHVPLPYRLGTGLHHLYHTLIHDDRPAQTSYIQLLQSEHCWQYLLNHKDRRCHPNQALHPKYLTAVHNKHNAAEFQPGGPPIITSELPLSPTARTLSGKIPAKAPKTTSTVRKAVTPLELTYVSMSTQVSSWSWLEEAESGSGTKPSASGGALGADACHRPPTGTDRAHKRSLGRWGSAALWCPRRIFSTASS